MHPFSLYFSCSLSLSSLWLGKQGLEFASALSFMPGRYTACLIRSQSASDLTFKNALADSPTPACKCCQACRSPVCYVYIRQPTQHHHRFGSQDGRPAQC